MTLISEISSYSTCLLLSVLVPFLILDTERCMKLYFIMVLTCIHDWLLRASTSLCIYEITSFAYSSCLPNFSFGSSSYWFIRDLYKFCLWVLCQLCKLHTSPIYGSPYAGFGSVGWFIWPLCCQMVKNGCPGRFWQSGYITYVKSSYRLCWLYCCEGIYYFSLLILFVYISVSSLFF